MAKPLFIRSAPPDRKRQSNVVVRHSLFAKYMQRPPTIMPNYGKKTTKIGVPKTSLSRVLLYDNITQQQMLDVKIANIKIEKQRAEHLLNMHRRAFDVQIQKRNPNLRKNNVKYKKKDISDVKSGKPNLPRLPSIDSRGTQMTSSTMTPLIRRFSTFTLDDVNLPDIGKHDKQILLKLKSQSGRRRLFHSYDETGMFVDLIPLFTFYPDVKDDPRFQKLETSLISPEVEDSAGYAMLSPSYEKAYPKIPEFLQEVDSPEGE